MDATGADFIMSLESLEKRLGVQGVAIQLPIGAEDTFEGIIDLIKMKAVYFEGAKGENVIYKKRFLKNIWLKLKNTVLKC